MAQHDYVIANGTGAAVRSDLNNALAAIVSQNSGATEPATTYAFQFWADTTTGLLKLRNSSNNAWVTLFQLDGEWSTLPVENGTAAAPSIYFKDSGTDTGFYSPGTDQVAISTAGTGRLFINSSGSVGIGTSSPGSYNSDASNLVIAGTGLVGATISSTNSGNSSIYFADGTTGNEAYRGVVSYAHSTDSMQLWTASTERIRIDSSGRVGIGTTSPVNSLVVSNGGAFGFEFDTGGGYLQTYNRSGAAYADLITRSATVQFRIENSEKARIDSSGRLLVGTSTAPSTGSLQYSKLFISGNTAGSGGSQIAVTRGQAFNGLASGQDLGYVYFGTYDGGEYGVITCFSDGASTASSTPGRLEFRTTASGASSPTERMRIGSNGIVYVGVTSASATNGGTVASQGYHSRSGIAGSFSSNIFNIYWNGSAARLWIDNSDLGSISVSSDYRIKKNIEAISSSCIERVKQLRPVQYELADYEDLFKADGIVREGFIAHEVQEVIPSGAEGNKDEENRIQNLRTDAIVAVLTKALQEAISKIEILEAKVAALESA